MKIAIIDVKTLKIHRQFKSHRREINKREMEEMGTEKRGTENRETLLLMKSVNKFIDSVTLNNS